jgi:bifunctional DNA-binding transcriptional regulator/antitoxin component of YhaV-PrlF toxin-antitoxin module
MEAFTVKLDGSGRILLPAKIRKQLKLQQGSTLVGQVKKDQLLLQTRMQALREVQAYFSQFRRKGKLLSEELIEDRRREARRERES